MIITCTECGFQGKAVERLDKAAPKVRNLFCPECDAYSGYSLTEL